MNYEKEYKFIDELDFNYDDHDLENTYDEFYYKESDEYLHQLFVYIHTRVEEYAQYKKVKICKNWYDFNKFKEDIIEIPNFDTADWEMDKDLLSDKNNKIYSKDTVCFIPRSINVAISKKSFIKNHGKAPYTSFMKDKGWYSTLQPKEERKYFDNDFSCFMLSRKLKREQLIEKVKPYRHMLPNNVLLALDNFNIGLDF